MGLIAYGSLQQHCKYADRKLGIGIDSRSGDGLPLTCGTGAKGINLVLAQADSSLHICDA